MLVNDNSKIYVGSTEVEKVYQGITLIYEKQGTPYTPLSYLESDGNQRIDTGYYISGSKATYKIKYNHISNNMRAVVGNYIARPYYKTVITIHGGNFYASNKNPTGIKYTLNEIHEIEMTVVAGTDNDRNGTYEIKENGQIIGSGGRVGAFPPSTTTYKNVIMFTQHSGGNYELPGANCRIYYFKMYDNDVLVRDFIPVLDENNVPCMYDRVTKQFYYNSGTGDFTYEL